MRKTQLLWLIPIVMLVLLPACSPAAPTLDTFAIYTAAANTVQAELTNAALLTPSPTATATVTETPLPTSAFTPTSQFSPTPQVTATIGQLMDKGEWVSQSINDGTEETPGTSFRVTWTLRNTGPTEWTNQYSLKFIGGDQMGAVAAVPLSKNVKYNETLDVTVDFVAPASLGAKQSNWCLYNASNQCFYPIFIKIVVVAGSATTPVPTSGVTPTA